MNSKINSIPAVVWVCLTVAFLAVVAAYVYLDVTGTAGGEFRGFMNIVLNLIGLALTGGALALSGKAANSANQAAEQTNGNLDKRIRDGVAAALATQRADDTRDGTR